MKKDNNEGTGKNEHIRKRNKVMDNEVEMCGEGHKNIILRYMEWHRQIEFVCKWHDYK